MATTNDVQPKAKSDGPGKKWLSRLMRVVLSITGLILLFSRLDAKELADVLQRVDLGFLLLSLAITTGSQFIPPWRWQIILRRSITFRHSCSATFVGNFVNAFTPLRMGEVVRAGLIRKNENIPLTESLSTIVLGQIMDVLSLVTLGILLVLFAPLPETLVQGGAIVGALALIGIFVLLATLRWSHLAELLIIRVAGEKRAVLLLRWFHNILNGLQTLNNPLQFFYALGLSLGFWLTTALAGWTLLPGLVESPGFMLGVAMAFGGGIGRLLPALPGSIGTLDFAVLVSLTALGVGDDAALAIVLLLRLRYMLVTVITGTLGMMAEDLSLSGLRQLISAPRQ